MPQGTPSTARKKLKKKEKPSETISPYKIAFLKILFSFTNDIKSNWIIHQVILTSSIVF
jgi:hypothetical protein